MINLLDYSEADEADDQTAGFNTPSDDAVNDENGSPRLDNELAEKDAGNFYIESMRSLTVDAPNIVSLFPNQVFLDVLVDQKDANKLSKVDCVIQMENN